MFTLPGISESMRQITDFLHAQFLLHPIYPNIHFIHLSLCSLMVRCKGVAGDAQETQGSEVRKEITRERRES